jgi:DNA-binding NarL/FixJ family response regulator
MWALYHAGEMNAVALIDAIYAQVEDPREWLEQVVRASTPLLDAGAGLVACTMDSIGGTGVRLGSVVQQGTNADMRGFVLQVTSTLSSADFAHTYGSPDVFESLSARAGPAFSADHWLFRAFREQFRVDDFDLLRVVDPAGFGLMVGAARDRFGRPPRRKKTQWARLAPHLAAGLRLNRVRRRPLGTSVLEDESVEAIADAHGRVVHATQAGRSRWARDTLRDAVRNMDRARASAKRDPLAAATTWQALVAGRWSMVDVFDTDGKRFVVARENRPRPSLPAALTAREREVIGFVEQGRSNKWIALTLGIAESTASEHVVRAMEKLGATDRMDLVKRLLNDRR